MKQRRNWAPVVGLLAGVGAVFAYFAMVTRPDAALHRFLDVPVIHLAVLGAGLVLSCIGIARSAPTWRSRGIAAALAVLNVAVAGAFAFFLFSASYAMPAAARAPAVGSVAPDFALPDERGNQVRLAALRGKPVVLLFYRGFW